MDGGDAEFLKTVSLLGCEVHSFDPSNSNASGGHLGNSLASNHGDGGLVSQHKMWLEWRAPRKRKHKTRGNLGGVSQTLADIMAALGHHTVRHTHKHRFGETVPNKHTLESFRPTIHRKLPYLCIPIATGLCAIPGCHGNNLSEWITHWPSCILQPQEGTMYQHFCMCRLAIYDGVQEIYL